MKKFGMALCITLLLITTAGASHSCEETPTPGSHWTDNDITEKRRAYERYRDESQLQHDIYIEQLRSNYELSEQLEEALYQLESLNDSTDR